MKNSSFICFFIILLVSFVADYSGMAQTVPLKIKKGTEQFETLEPIFFVPSKKDGRYSFNIAGKLYQLSFKDGGLQTSWQKSTLYLNDFIHIPALLNNRKFDYQLEICNFGGDGEWISLKCNSYLEMEYNNQTIRFFDKNINGRFDDIAVDLISINNEKPTLLSKLLFLKSGANNKKNELLEWNIVKSGNSITFTKYVGKTTNLEVALDNPSHELISLTLLNPVKKSFIAMNKILSMIVKPGKYNFVRAIIKYKSEGGRYLTFVANANRKRKLTINIKDNNHKIKIGPPFEMKVEALKVGRRSVKINDVFLLGSAGENYEARAFLGKDRVVSSLTLYQEDGSKKTEICKLEYG